MNEAARNFWVGTFVVVSLVVLATLMAWFGETPEWLGGNEWNLRIVGVKDLAGVDPGASVRLNGVEIGRVRALEFADAKRADMGVYILTRINDRYDIPQQATARVYGATLGFGAGRIEIVFDSSELYTPIDRENAEIYGEMRSIIGELITKDMIDSVRRTIDNIGDFAGAATPVANNLAKILEPRSVKDVSAEGSTLKPNIATVVERLDQLVANVNAVLGDVNVQEDVKGAVRDLKTAVADLKGTAEIWRTESQKLSDNLNTGIDRTEENLDRSFRQLNSVLDHLDETSKSLVSIFRAIDQGEGTAGKLVRDERLYESGVLTLQRFTESLATLNRILGSIEEKGTIPLSLGSSGLIKTEIPTPAKAAEKQ